MTDSKRGNIDSMREDHAGRNVEIKKTLEKEKVDVSTLTVGTPIKIKQSGETHWDSSASFDSGDDGLKAAESWIDTVITSVHPSDDADDRFITTKEHVRQMSFTVNEFSENQIWRENGVLYADPSIQED